MYYLNFVISGFVALAKNNEKKKKKEIATVFLLWNWNLQN
jgi:hypothetical protein